MTTKQHLHDGNIIAFISTKQLSQIGEKHSNFIYNTSCDKPINMLRLFN